MHILKDRKRAAPPPRGQTRTRASIAACLVAHKEKHKEKWQQKSAAESGSISKDPVIEWEPKDMVPIPLHIFLGVFVKLYDLLMKTVRSDLDHQGPEAQARRTAFEDAVLEAQMNDEYFEDSDDYLSSSRSCPK